MRKEVKKSELLDTMAGVPLYWFKEPGVHLSIHDDAFPLRFLRHRLGYRTFDFRAHTLDVWASEKSGKSIQGLDAYWRNYYKKHIDGLYRKHERAKANKLAIEMAWAFFKKNGLTKPSGR